MEKSSVPEVIQIGPYTFTIDIDPRYVDSHNDNNNLNVAGMSEFHKQKITLNQAEGPDYLADTLLHEVLHMCLRAVSCDIELDVSNGIRENLEERLVSSLSTILLDTMRRNPELINYLLLSI